MRSKMELCEKILERLLDEGYITLEFGVEDSAKGERACVEGIYSVLKEYTIVQGAELENDGSE